MKIIRAVIVLAALAVLVLSVGAAGGGTEQAGPILPKPVVVEPRGLMMDGKVEAAERLATRRAEVALWVATVKENERIATARRQRVQSAASSAPVRAAVTGDIWSRLAQCESGNTNANTGNGYYGYFQFHPATWRSVGGTGLPIDHGYGEQLHRAQILQSRSGWGQWPACSRKLGLR